MPGPPCRTKSFHPRGAKRRAHAKRKFGPAGPLADELAPAQRRTLEGQTHMVKVKVLGLAVAEFFTESRVAAAPGR
jgi:hypothetical protein